MPLISLVAAVDEQGGLGYNNQLLCHLPADLQYFKKLTMGKPIVMGRKTFSSIGKVLPGRLNIILSNTISGIEGATVVRSFDEVLNITANEPEIMIIGGGKLFSQIITQANRIYLTIIHHQFKADAFFPPLESDWICKGTKRYPRDEKNHYDLTFCIYERKDSSLQQKDESS